MAESKVLLVDDEMGVLNACQRLLRNEKFELVATTSTEEAVIKVAQETFAVVLSDQRMPGMDGTELLEKIREIAPESIRIILTGYADSQAAIDAINRGSVYRFLTKPWNDEELRLTIRQAVAQFELHQENKRLHALTQEQNIQLKDLNENLEKKVIERTQEISRLNQKLEKSFLETVEVLGGLGEMHSAVVGNHSKRVAALARDVAVELDLIGSPLFELEIAAMLHDIGKVAVPPEILVKSESFLTDIEKERLRSHPVKGEAIVKMVSDLENVAKMIRHHHEKFEGGGYPDRLKRREIPLGSRIIAAVDAYDKALNSRATFDTATPERALLFVQSHCPQDFDPEVVAKLALCVHQSGPDFGAGSEIEIRPKDLCVGMILSRDLRTVGNVLLLPMNTEIRESYLERIHNFQETDPVVDSIYIYRKPQIKSR